MARQVLQPTYLLRISFSVLGGKRFPAFAGRPTALHGSLAETTQAGDTSAVPTTPGLRVDLRVFVGLRTHSGVGRIGRLEDEVDVIHVKHLLLLGQAHQSKPPKPTELGMTTR